MTRLFRDQAQQQQAKVALLEHPLAAAAPAMPAKASFPIFRMPEGVTAMVGAVVVVIMKSMHSSPFLDISMIQIYLSCVGMQACGWK